MKHSPIDSVSHKAIMYLIFIRTILDLAVETMTDEGIPIKHNLTHTALLIYKQGIALEKAIYRKNKRLSDKYIESNELCRPVWSSTKETMGDNYKMYLEPLVTALYYDCRNELKAIGMNNWLFDQLMDSYFTKHNCALEPEYTRIAKVVQKQTEKALFEFKKLKKREAMVA